jgi:hypothetical protein
VAVLIDPPAWPAHGRLWSHLVSDVSLAELHGFARGLGVPARGFEGDHYDVPQERYQAVVAAGAQPVSGRDLLLRLQASGLRRPKRRGERVLASVPHEPSGLRLDVLSSVLPPPGAVSSVMLIAERPAEVSGRRPAQLLVLTGPDHGPVSDPGPGSGADPVAGGLRWPWVSVPPGAAAGAVAALLLRQLLGSGAARRAAPTQLGFLRYVPHPSGPASGFELVLHWTAPDGGTPAPAPVSSRRTQAVRGVPAARWMPAEEAVRGLPPVLSVLLPGEWSGEDLDRSELWAPVR